MWDDVIVADTLGPFAFTMNTLTQQLSAFKVARAGGNAARRTTTMARGATRKAAPSGSVWCVPWRTSHTPLSIRASRRAVPAREALPARVMLWNARPAVEWAWRTRGAAVAPVDCIWRTSSFCPIFWRAPRRPWARAGRCVTRGAPRTRGSGGES